MTIKQKIWDKLDKDGYIIDKDLAEIYGGEPNYYVAEQYKKAYYRLKNDKEKFAEFENNKNTILRVSGNRRKKYLIRDRIWENLKWYQISKEYFNYLKEKGVEIACG